MGVESPKRSAVHDSSEVAPSSQNAWRRSPLPQAHQESPLGRAHRGEVLGQARRQLLVRFGRHRTDEVGATRITAESKSAASGEERSGCRERSAGERAAHHTPTMAEAEEGESPRARRPSVSEPATNTVGVPAPSERQVPLPPSLISAVRAGAPPPAAPPAPSQRSARASARGRRRARRRNGAPR